MIQLAKTQQEVNEELKALYKKWPDVHRYLKALGCKTADAEDIFQEALLIYARKNEGTEFNLTVAPFHYIKNTCKYIWYNQARKERKHPTVELEDFTEFIDDDWFQKELKLKQIENAISHIGEKCQLLLKLFYGLGMSMADIAKKLDFRNDKVAKAQKYRCIHSVKEIVQNQSNS
jgi:RNA polymerase sigma factor (sigma-70 family)